MFQEDFLDLTVAVKNVSGLEDALWKMYVEEEVFEHDNLYQCGACDRLVKAAKVERRASPPHPHPRPRSMAGRAWDALHASHEILRPGAE